MQVRIVVILLVSNRKSPDYEYLRYVLHMRWVRNLTGENIMRTPPMSNCLPTCCANAVPK